jgi:hypothetical protein
MLILALGVAASAEWKEKVLYSFQGGTDGAVPAGGVVFDRQGNLYGATQQGGGTNWSPMAACGTVYQLAPPGHMRIALLSRVSTSRQENPLFRVYAWFDL